MTPTPYRRKVEIEAVLVTDENLAAVAAWAGAAHRGEQWLLVAEGTVATPIVVGAYVYHILADPLFATQEAVYFEAQWEPA